MYGLYIYSNDFTPQIHAFADVDAAKAFVARFAEENDIDIDVDGISTAENGFYAEDNLGGIIEFECRPITDHRPDDTGNWRRQALEENAALDVLREENEKLRRVITGVCKEDGYACMDCVNADCPFAGTNGGGK